MKFRLTCMPTFSAEKPYASLPFKKLGLAKAAPEFPAAALKEFHSNVSGKCHPVGHARRAAAFV